MMAAMRGRAKWLVVWLLLCGDAACQERRTLTRPDDAKPVASPDEPGDSSAKKGAGRSPHDAPDDGILVSNVAELRKRVGQKVVVTGTIQRTNISKSGRQFLNFADSELTLVCTKSDAAKFKQSPAEQYRGREVEVTGKLELFENKLQIALQQSAQIRIVESKAANQAKSIELEKVGKNEWRSPAGLRYAGRDPEGLTRVEHILRHTKDMPDRDGAHGVFDGGEGVAWAVIDEAWQLARKNKIEPRNEGDRSSLTVPMRRRIGYLGGRLGKARNHPPLTRVFIVFETDTQNIITAFPK